MVQIKDKAILPLLGFVGTAVTLACTFGSHKLITSPDVRISKEKRTQVIRSPKDDLPFL